MSDFEHQQPPRIARRRSSERGIALLLVLTLVVMFTAFVADFTYSSRVKYTMASHARDAAQAEALAVSGLRVYQLLLLMGDSAQSKIAKSPFAASLGALLGSGSLVVRLIPVLDTGLLRMLAGGAPPEEEPAEAAPASSEAKGPTRVADSSPMGEGSFLGFDGDFSVTAKEESSKISLNGMIKSGLTGSSAQLLIQSLKKEEYQPLFREQNITPEELVSNIIDWGDFNGERANGQGYEDNLYNKLADPYNAKNAPFDTVSELHLVAGMTDELYDLIAPLVTAYTTADGITLPLTDINMMGGLLRAIAPNHRWTDTDIEQVWQQFQLNTVLAPPDNAQTLLTALQESTSQLSGLTLETLKPFIVEAKARPKVFLLTATGRVNDVERTVQTVIDISKNAQYGGWIRYWREE